MCDLHDHTQCNDAWIYVRDVDVPITCVPWLIRMCAMTHSRVRPAQSQRVTRYMPCLRASPLRCTPVLFFQNNKWSNSAAAASSVCLFLGGKHPTSSLCEADGEHLINRLVSWYNCTRISCKTWYHVRHDILVQLYQDIVKIVQENHENHLNCTRKSCKTLIA